MAGRKQFHNSGYRQYFKQTKQKQKAIQDDMVTYSVPRIYAAIALTLYDRFGWEHDQIAELFGESEQLWGRSIEEGWDMLANCYECTGIEVRHFKQTGNITYDR